MCNGDFCPCAPTVNPDNYGDRADEFELLDTTGRVLRFYEDCYEPVLMSSDTGINKEGFTERKFRNYTCRNRTVFKAT